MKPEVRGYTWTVQVRTESVERERSGEDTLEERRLDSKDRRRTGNRVIDGGTSREGYDVVSLIKGSELERNSVLEQSKTIREEP